MTHKSSSNLHTFNSKREDRLRLGKHRLSECIAKLAWAMPSVGASTKSNKTSKLVLYFSRLALSLHKRENRRRLGSKNK